MTDKLATPDETIDYRMPDGPEADDRLFVNSTEEERAELFRRNLAMFKAQFPDLAATLERHRPVSQLIVKEDGQPSVKFRDFDLYPDGAYTNAERQAETFQLLSERLMQNIRSDGLDLHSRQMLVKMEQEFAASGFRFANRPIREKAYFGIVFGLGLGVHLSKIIERIQCKVLVVVESNMDFLYHSLSVVDWAQIALMLGEAGKIQFVIGDDPEILAKRIHPLFRVFNPASLDGTYLFRHYQSSIFQETERILEKSFRTAVMGLGFYQDEINMIAQTYKNLEHGTARVIKRLEANPGLPCFIVGTGPSLEGLLDFIKDNQHKAVIFACGTSIDVMMARGIQPDFWVMTERSSNILPQAQESAEMFDLSEVRFAGSSTIYPGVTDCFKEAILFFRPGLSSAPCFSRREDQIVTLPDPLAANAGAAFAMHTGFREFYFLGVDVGSKFKSHGHAKGSWYERHDAENIKDLDLPLKGNLGGTVWTTPELQWSKENLEKLARMGGGRVMYNLGDGALIDGITPKHRKAVNIAEPSMSKKDLVERLVESCPIYALEDFEDSWETQAVADRLYEYGAKLKEIMEVNKDLDDFIYLSKTADLMEFSKAEAAIPMVLRGTVATVMMAYENYANRMDDAEERKSMANIFRKHFIEMVDHLVERGSEIFLGLEDGGAWEEFVS